MQVPVVNDKDEVIGYKDRSLLDYENDIFRSASLWITNSRGDVLLAQRKKDKKVEPERWGEAVGGTVEGADSYESTVIRESEEELGLKNINIQIGPKQFISNSAKYFVQWYTAVIDLPIESFELQDDEVEQIAWIPLRQLKQEITEYPEKYISALKEAVDLF